MNTTPRPRPTASSRSSRVFRRWLRQAGACALAGLVAAATCRGVEPYEPRRGDPMAEPWRIRTFPELSGLGLRCMTQTSDGALWFATTEAFWSYDGLRWKENRTSLVFTNGPETLCPGPDGSLYAGGVRWGIVRHHAGVWTALYRLEQPSLDVRKLIFSRDGTLWAATSLGLLRLRDGVWTLFTDPTTAGEFAAVKTPTTELRRVSEAGTARFNLTDVTEDRAGRLWIVTNAREVFASTATVYGVADVSWQLRSYPPELNLAGRPALLALRDGRVWMGAASSAAVLIFDGDRVSRLDLEPYAVPVDTSHMLQTRGGTILLSSRYVVTALREGLWKTYTAPDAPIPTATNFLLQSEDGALWIAGPSTEIVRVDYESVRWDRLLDLNFQYESPEHARWFLHRSGRIVRNEGDTWTSFGPEDGAIDSPVVLIGTRSGDIWVAGSHESTAATARFDGTAWTRQVHRTFSWGIEWRSVFESSDGSIWFSACVDSSGPAHHRAGILQYRDGTWLHHHQPGRASPPDDDSDLGTLLPATRRPEPIGKFISMAESGDGRIWTGRNFVAVRDATSWSVAEPLPGSKPIIESMLSTREGELWLGTRQLGVLHYDGRAWRHIHNRDGLITNGVRSMAQTSDGSIWAITDRDISRFDGRLWYAGRLPSQLLPLAEGGHLRAGRADSIWVNHYAPDWMRRAWPRAADVDTTTCVFSTALHTYRGVPPETTILTDIQKIPQPGNVSIQWTGTDPWRHLDDLRLQFSHKLDDGPWTPFGNETVQAFFTLPVGRHRLEVRARDHDFNIDPTPAAIEFTVLPPVWREPWFIALIVLLVGTVVTQSMRVLLERRRLRVANRDLAAQVEERTRAEQALRASEASLKEAQQLAHLGSWSLDLETDRLQWSDEVYRILELQPEPGLVSYSVFLEAVHPDDRAAVDKAMRQSARDHTSHDFEHRLLLPDKRVKFIHERCRTVFDSEGQPRRVLGIAQDITHRRELEQQMRQAQKMEAVGKLAGGVAHDFNNILAAITMQVELASLSQNVPLEVTDELQEIRAAATRAASLTRQLLLFSRRQVMQPQEIDLNEVVTQLGKMLNRLIGEHVHVEHRLHPAPLRVFADSGMVDQVILNLTVNARDAMPDGGRIVIETLERTVPDDAVPSAPHAYAGRFACLRVRDTGTGIPPEVLPHIFEPFFTTKEPGKGTGLGLATVFGIVRQHRGWISVETAVGAGTCFEIHLPLSAGHAPAGAPVAAPKPAGGTETILFVEDDPSVRTTTRAFLSRHGYRVIDAVSGAGALALWARHRGEVDLLLTDLVLPDGVHGVKLARLLRDDDPRVRVVFMSGYATEAREQKDVPPDAVFLHKPFKPDDLLRALRASLGG